MKVEDSQALRFILQDEIYLLNEDKLNYAKPDNQQTPASQPQPETITLKPIFNYLGANKKHFLVLTNYPNNDFIADDHLAALESVLGRKNHGREDVAILNAAKNNSEYSELLSHFKPQTILILGEQAIPSGIDQPKFNQVEKRDGINLLYTFAFDTMMSNVDNKKAFWEQVKSL
ncbi:hypothetical protein [Mucilaginibacter sp. BT774]|uniref:hypothetical protein n=1 Tax=Mucilaginibacter sp. BT774 TaxID=3062276 RepID=UPI00267510D3|nr:hypothetical protein [Mucilaginibacter sp. BT774]MDO3625593.1 hypothetical protein [Mucilaginibacter sp. BT774]